MEKREAEGGGLSERPLPSYIGPREKLSLRSSNSLAVQSGCLAPTQVKRKKDARERAQAEGNCWQSEHAETQPHEMGEIPDDQVALP